MVSSPLPRAGRLNPRYGEEFGGLESDEVRRLVGRVELLPEICWTFATVSGKWSFVWWSSSASILCGMIHFLSTAELCPSPY